MPKSQQGTAPSREEEGWEGCPSRAPSATKKTEPCRFASCNAAEPDFLLPRCLQHYCCFVTPCGGTSCQADEGHRGLRHQCGASGARGTADANLAFRIRRFASIANEAFDVQRKQPS